LLLNLVVVVDLLDDLRRQIAGILRVEGLERGLQRFFSKIRKPLNTEAETKEKLSRDPWKALKKKDSN
jgi:hypothetical protein